MRRASGGKGRSPRHVWGRQLGANLDNPQNKAFVDAFLKDYDVVPGVTVSRPTTRRC